MSRVLVLISIITICAFDLSVAHYTPYWGHWRHHLNHVHNPANQQSVRVQEYREKQSQSPRQREPKLAVSFQVDVLLCILRQQTYMRCPPGVRGRQPFIYDCAKYVNCVYGGGYVHHCAPGTLFNPNIRACDVPYKVKCYGRHWV